METVENGWNKLVDIYLQEVAKEIEEFMPSGSHPKVFGKDIASTMAKIIESIK